MIDLTARQIQILRAIIEEFIENAGPVGSDTIDRKFGIGVSPATIRNEMVYLTNQGYLKKEHTSAGRAPTPLALKLYVNELMKEKELSVADEVSTKEKIWNSRTEIDDLLRQATRVLADRTRSLAIALTPNNRLYHAGYANLLNMPEFYDINVVRHVLTLIEEARLMDEMFESSQTENTIKLVFGQDLDNKFLEPIGLIYTNVQAGEMMCHIGVLGSTRFRYDYVIPLLKYFKGIIEEMTHA